MTPAAIGIRAHSGWGWLVAVAGRPSAVEVIERRRIAIAKPDSAGANQPYHFAKERELPEAERHLAFCAGVSERLAYEAIAEVVNRLRRREYSPRACAILQSAGRPLPPLAQILSSHALIHAAEGEFFRLAFWKAGERLGMRVTGIRERDLGAMPLRREIAELGRSLGPPWTADLKAAALAALLVLSV